MRFNLFSMAAAAPVAAETNPRERQTPPPERDDKPRLENVVVQRCEQMVSQQRALLDRATTRRDGLAAELKAYLAEEARDSGSFIDADTTALSQARSRLREADLKVEVQEEALQRAEADLAAAKEAAPSREQLDKLESDIEAAITLMRESVAGLEESSTAIKALCTSAKDLVGTRHSGLRELNRFADAIATEARKLATRTADHGKAVGALHSNVWRSSP